MDAWFGGYRSALRHGGLRLLSGALVVSASGSRAYNVALIAFTFAAVTPAAAAIPDPTGSSLTRPAPLARLGRVRARPPGPPRPGG
jgi:hypothetical protein